MKNLKLILTILALLIFIFCLAYAIIYLTKENNTIEVPGILKTEEQKKQDRLEEVSNTLDSLRQEPATEQELNDLQKVLNQANKEPAITSNTSTSSSDLQSNLDSQKKAEERANINKLLESN